MSRFQFIVKEYPEIFKLCSEAEKNKRTNTELSMLKARQAFEKILALANPDLLEDDLFDQINSLYDKCTLSELKTMHALRRLGDMAIHGNRVSEQKAEEALTALLLSCCWLYFKIDGKTCHVSLFEQEDRDVASFYVKIALKRKGNTETRLTTYHVTNPLAFDNNFDEVDDTRQSVLDKNVFETEEEYEERIRHLPPVHLGFAMIDDKQIDPYTQLAFPRFSLYQDEKITGADINALVGRIEPENDVTYDGEILVSLKVRQGKIYYDYSKVVLQSDTNELPLTALYWDPFAYETYIDFNNRMEQLPVLPIGVCKPIRQEYDIDKQLLPFQISSYDFVQDVFSDISLNVSVNRGQAKQVCQYSGGWQIYGKLVHGESDYFIEAKVISRRKIKSPVTKDCDTITIKCNVDRKQSAKEQYELGKTFYDDEDYAEAVKWYRRAANKGNAEAQNDLGLCYYYGEGVEEDETEAVRWFWDAAMQGNARAQNNLGNCYYYGKGVKQDNKEAVEWYQGATAKGNADAQYSLGNMHEYGHVVEQSYEKAVEWYRKAAEQGQVRALCKLGYMYEYGKGVKQSDEKAVEWYRKAAKQGDAYAQNELGDRYCFGEGVEESDETAVEWYRKAAEQGYASAQNELGDRYYFGTGVKQSDETAVKWYRKAAEQGNANAQCNLGGMYEYGLGVEQSYKTAVEWYRKAAEQGHASAQNELGDRYYFGTGVEQSYETAAEWYRKAAEQGSAIGQYNLGDMYEYGKGVEQSNKKAVGWYRKAAVQGNAEAQCNLGYMYEFGKGVRRSDETAVIWYRKAAEQGSAIGQYNLGDMYEYGKGVEQSYEMAMKWYQKAAEQGNAAAKERLKNLKNL